MKIGTIRFITILFVLLIPLDTQAQIDWGVNEAFTSLVTDQNLISIGSIHTEGNRVFVSAVKADFTVHLYYSDDNGNSWEEATSDNAAGQYQAFANSRGDVIFSFGTDLFGNRFLRKSEDNGSSWAVQASDYSNFPFIFIPTHLEAINDTLLLTSTARDVGMFKSVDGGATWNVFNTFDSDGNRDIQRITKNDGFFFLASKNHGLYRSHRDSTNWNLVKSLGNGENIANDIEDVLIDNQNRVIILTTNGIEYSEDNGDTWTEVLRNSFGVGPEGLLIRMELLGDDLLVVVADAINPRVLIISNFSSSTVINSGLTDFTNGSRFQILQTTDNSVAYAKRLNGDTQLWQRGMGVATSNERNGFSPESFSLEQNFPNPFNPTTNIRFSLREASVVSINVYNLLGQQVASIAKGRFAAGSHTFSFDASSLSSGVYIYQLRSGSSLLTRKMTLVK